MGMLERRRQGAIILWARIELLKLFEYWAFV
jgi:hypothetical protein